MPDPGCARPLRIRTPKQLRGGGSNAPIPANFRHSRPHAPEVADPKPLNVRAARRGLPALADGVGLKVSINEDATIALYLAREGC